MADASSPRLPSRLVVLFAASVVVLAAIGFVTGTQSQRYVPTLSPESEARPRPVMAPEARSNAELALYPWGDAEPVVLPGPDAAPPESRERGGTVAYAGAPPTIPHPVRASGPAECLGCHANGVVLGSTSATPIPHRTFASCTQCHVSALPAIGEVPTTGPASVESRFSGWQGGERGTRALPTAPPTVPHPTFMRERCVSCHGPLGRVALETPHPERQSCSQCHVAPLAAPPGA